MDFWGIQAGSRGTFGIVDSCDIVQKIRRRLPVKGLHWWLFAPTIRNKAVENTTAPLAE